MTNYILCVLCVTVGLLNQPARSQAIVGIWQGTVPGAAPERVVVTVSEGADQKLSCGLNAVDHVQIYPLICSYLAGVFKFSIPQNGASYDGRIAPDGRSVTGTWKWNTNGQNIALLLEHATEETSWAADRTEHQATFVTVEPGVRLEVLDWGGSGRALVLLAGLGDNAHVYDTLAPKLTSRYHVYGITRRGFGASSSPEAVWQNYSADRLGDDVVAVLDELKLGRPVLIGHSIAGEELSSIGSRFPGRVSGLIYLDAGSSYALYFHSAQSLLVDWNEMRNEVGAITNAPTPQAQRALIKMMLETELPQYRQELKDREAFLQDMPDQPPPSDQVTNSTGFKISQAIHNGEQRYSGITCPVLAIFNEPSPLSTSVGTDPKSQAQATREAANRKAVQEQEDAFKALGGNVHVVTITGGSHYVFRSNEAEVLRNIDLFIGNLPQGPEKGHP